MKMNDLDFDEVKIGDIFEFNKVITNKDMESFTKLTGNLNPLHCDEDYAKNTKFKGVIIHGMHAANFFSTLLGMLCPGKKCLCLSQTLNFKNPIYPNSEITIRGVVKDKIESVKIIVLDTEIICQGIVVVNGEAKVTII